MCWQPFKPCHLLSPQTHHFIFSCEPITKISLSNNPFSFIQVLLLSFYQNGRTYLCCVSWFCPVGGNIVIPMVAQMLEAPSLDRVRRSRHINLTASWITVIRWAAPAHAFSGRRFQTRGSEWWRGPVTRAKLSLGSQNTTYCKCNHSEI